MTEPVDVATAKLHARVDGDAEDALFPGWITTARRWVEAYTGHILVQRDVTERIDWCGRGSARLNAWPVDPEALVTLTYLDSAGVSQSFTDFRLNAGDRPAVLLPTVGSWWPYGTEATATFEAGYATPDDVPEDMKQAIYVIVGGLYDDRVITEEVERAAMAICRPYRLLSV